MSDRMIPLTTEEILVLVRAARLALGDTFAPNWTAADDERLFATMNALLAQLGDHPLEDNRFEHLLESREAEIEARAVRTSSGERIDVLIEESHSDADPGL